MTKPAITWPGGKRWAAKHILPLIPAHDCYAEPFAGGLAILLAKPPSKNEVINDTHSDLINFYRVSKYHPDELLREMNHELNSRQTLKDYQAQPGLTDIQRAARWYRRIRLSFGGLDGNGYAVSAGTSRGCSSVSYAMGLIQPLSERLDAVSIEHLDYARFLTLYDKPRTFFFLDPPYTHCDDSGNYAGWSMAQLQTLLDRLKTLKASWLLTINDRPEIRDLLTTWHILPLTRNRGINCQKGVTRTYGELLVSPQRIET